MESTRDERPDVQLARLDDAIERLEDEVGFRACFAGLMRYACDCRVWEASRIIFRGMDDETFYGVRAWLISRGRQRYFEVLEDPDALASGPVDTFEAFAERISGRGDELEGEFSGEPLDDDDPAALREAFPELANRYRNAWTWAGAQNAMLFTRRELAAQRRWAWCGLVLTLGLSIAAWLMMPWYWALLASIGSCVGFLAAVSRAGSRRTVGAFVSRARGLGNASRLVGDVEIAVVCVRPTGGPKSAWTEGNLAEALALLREEAQRYGVVLSFRRVEETQTVAELPQLLGRFGEYDPEAVVALQRHIEPLTPRSNGFVLVFSDQHDCTPTAWPTCRLRGGGLEFCVCPHHASAKTIAHEILHLFGAHDLYVLSRPGALVHQSIVEDVASFVHPVVGEDIRETSIMTNLQRPGLSIDPVTAAAVGWTRSVAGRRVPIYRSHAPDG